MKRCNLIIVLFLSLSFSGFCQKVTVNNLDSTTLLIRLFGSSDIKRDAAFGIIGGWKPTILDSVSGMADFANSDDNRHLCYTKIDTVLYYSEENNKYAIVAFEIIPPFGHGLDCHSCGSIASIAKLQLEKDSSNTNFWSVQYFNKNFLSSGQYGALGGQFSTAKLGDKHCLVYDFSGTYNGSAEALSTYFNIDNEFKEVFKFVSFHIRFGVPINDKEVDLESSATLKVLKNGNFQLTTKEESGMITKSLYQYDDTINYYVKVGNPMVIKNMSASYSALVNPNKGKPKTGNQALIKKRGYTK